MMKKTKLIAGILAFASAAAMASGCQKQNETASESKPETKKEETAGYIKFPSKLTAEKVGSFEVEYLTSGQGGMYYENEDDEYGVMTFDGKKDTGAKYYYCKPEADYFLIVKEEPDNTIDGMNVMGMIDAKGNEIIPAEYSTIKVLNERYVRVCKATEETTSKDEALIYSTDRMVSLNAEDGDTLYKGTWCVYDLETKEKVNGVEGTAAYSVYANGDIITYGTDDGERKVVNAEGEEMPEDAKILTNGTYVIEDETVYDSNGNELFETDGYRISVYLNGYYVATTDKDGETSYVLIDESGEVASAEFASSPTVYEGFILAKDTVYDFEGNALLDDKVQSVTVDKFTGCVAKVRTDSDEIVILDITGDVIYRGKEDVDSNFVVKKDGNCYLINEESFETEGYSVAPWLIVTASDDGTRNVIDTISGEVIIEGYTNYTGACQNGETYIYAKTEDGTFDIYKIK